MHPYWGASWIEAIGLFGARFFQFLTGASLQIAPDEMQLLTLLASSISSSIIGGLLFLRKGAMMANSLSHTVLFGLIIAVLLIPNASVYRISMSVLITGAIIAALLTVAATEMMVRWFRLKEDAGIGFIFTTIFAVSILLVTLYTKSAHFGVESITGNIDAIQMQDVYNSIIVAIVTLIYFSLFFQRIKVAAFDPLFAQAVGVFPRLHQYILLALTSMIAISSFKSFGVILFLGLIIIFPSISYLFRLTFIRFFMLSAITSSIVSVLSIAISRHLLSYYNIAISTSGLFITFATIVFILAAATTTKSATRTIQRKEL